MPPQPVLLVIDSTKGQTEALTCYFKRKENIFYFIQLKICINIHSLDAFLAILKDF